MNFIKNSIKTGPFVFVNPIAVNKKSFYMQFGFQTRPNERVGAG